MSVVVVRPAPQGERTAKVLRETGIAAVAVALTAQGDPADGGAALDAALADLGAVELVAVASAEGARRLLAALGSRVPGEGCEIAAVGPSTAEVLERAGLVVYAMESSGGAALAEAIGEPARPGARAVVLMAEGGRPELADGLEAAGWSVDRVVAYATVPVQPSEGELAQLGAAELLVVAAPSSARRVVELVGSATTSGQPRRVVAIGSTTAAESASLGLEVAKVAAEPNDAGVLEAVEDLLA